MAVVNVAYSGALLTGRADAVLEQFAADAAEQIAQAAHQQLHRWYTLTFRYEKPDRRPGHPGWYRGHTVTDISRPGFATVHDSNVIYGNWLEGTSSRNATTRFKGYANFRRVTQNIGKLAPRMAERIMTGYLRELGG